MVAYGAANNLTRNMNEWSRYIGTPSRCKSPNKTVAPRDSRATPDAAIYANHGVKLIALTSTSFQMHTK